MSNLHTAKLAIEAEIAHAKQGLDYYAEKVKSLQQALAGVVQAEGSTAAASPTSSKALKSPTKTGKRKAAPGKRGGIAQAATATQAGELPSTGGDYWKNLVATEPKSGRAILAEAINGLGFTPTRAQVGKLMNRMTFALNSMVKAGTIQDSGTGRERRFFKN